MGMRMESRADAVAWGPSKEEKWGWHRDPGQASSLASTREPWEGAETYSPGCTSHIRQSVANIH